MNDLQVFKNKINVINFIIFVRRKLNSLAPILSTKCLAKSSINPCQGEYSVYHSLLLSPNIIKKKQKKKR